MNKYLITGVAGVAVLLFFAHHWNVSTKIKQPQVKAPSPGNPTEPFHIPSNRILSHPALLSAAGKIANVNKWVEKTNSERSEAVERLMAHKNQYPPYQIVAALSITDEAPLAELYAGESELTNKLALTWALASIGGDLAAQALKTTLTADYFHKKLTVKEREVVRDTIEALGLIAARSQMAYDFLNVAATETYWKENRTWEAAKPKSEQVANFRMAGLAIQALGASLRPEVLVRIKEIKETNSEFTHEVYDSAATAAFYYDLGNEKGADALLKFHLSGDSSMRDYERWTKTENGSNWWHWALKMASTPKP